RSIIIENEMFTRGLNCAKDFDETGSIPTLRAAGYILRVAMQAARDRIRYHSSKEVTSEE
ncbi:MAG: hypothetical protein ACTSPO_15480, partial [Candidatus Heimdallarchaeaceae archaeon]